MNNSIPQSAGGTKPTEANRTEPPLKEGTAPDLLADHGYPDIPLTLPRERKLFKNHRHMLEVESGISPAAIDARGYFTVTSPAVMHSLAFDKKQSQIASTNSPVLIIPTRDYQGKVTGYIARPDIPRNGKNGKPIKYETPAGVSNTLDISPLTADKIDDPDIPLSITEGAKKADSAASRDLCCLSVSGVYGWRGKNGRGGLAALPDWEPIAVNGRIVNIIFDSDVSTKPQVRNALQRLVSWLKSRGSIVKVIYLPEGDNGAKTGLDDFFARGGTVADLYSHARDLVGIEESKRQQKAASVAEYHLSADAKPTREISNINTIPRPTMADERGRKIYDKGVLVKLLYPHWNVATLNSHAAHAQRIKEILGNDLCYNANLGWLIYNGQNWERGDKHATAAAARVAELSQVIRDEAATLYDITSKLVKADRRECAFAMSVAATEHAAHARQAETKSFADGALHFAAGILAVDTSLFDQKPWVIGFRNGTWARGEWREHRRDDRLLSFSPVKYHPTIDRSEWNAVLSRITGGNVEFAHTLQDIAGYTLSGASHLRLMPWLYGPKGTGKSTFTELLKTVLNHLAAVVDPKLLHDASTRARLGASLWGRRLAVCTEAGNQKMNAELLKTLTGTDTLTVRFLFRESFDAPPRHVLLMVANDPPKMNAYDDALKDRVLALPFIHELNDGGEITLTGGKRLEAVRQDPNSLLVRGFCAWAVEGLAHVYETQNIRKAKTVMDATRKFWQDTDQVTPFWETIPDDELKRGIGKAVLRARYEEWCKGEGALPLGRNLFNEACKSHLLSEHALLIDDKRVKGWKS